MEICVWKKSFSSTFCTGKVQWFIFLNTCSRWGPFTSYKLEFTTPVYIDVPYKMGNWGYVTPKSL